MRMKQEKQNNLMNRFERIGFALVLTMLVGFLAPGGLVGPSVAQADTLSVTGNTPIASGSKTDTAAYVIMQRFQVNSTALDDGVVLNSLTLNDDTATATAYRAARIYISLSSVATSTLPAGAVQIGKSATYTGASQAVPLNLGTVADRTVTSAAPKYLYIVYDMAPGQATSTALSRVTAVGVAAPDTGATGLTIASNVLTLTGGVNAVISACNGCHGNNAVFSDATTTRNVPAGLFPGSHNSHAGGAPLSLTCDKCHVNPVEINHLNGLINMANLIYNAGGSYTKSGATYSFAQSNVPSPLMGQCSNVYCHGTATPTWGGTLSDVAECDSCHGGNAASTATAGLGQITLINHPDHMNNVAVLGTNYECVVCHSTTVSAGNDRAVTGAVHVDGTKNVSMPLGGTWTPGTLTCSTVYCHSSGKGTYAAVPAWNSATSLTCNGCHGTTAAVAGTPDYANAGAGLPNANSHAKHVAAAADCNTCHTNTTTTGLAIRAASVLHTNNAINVSFNTATAGASATWTPGTKTCSTTYCHGSAGVVWGAATTCTSCHVSQGAGTGTAAYLGGHQKHANATTYKFACDNCHDPEQAAHAGGLASGVTPSQAAQVLFENSGTAGTWLTKQYGGGGTTFNYTRINASPYGLAAPTPAYAKGVTAGAADNGFPWTTNGSCSSVWCHSNANPRTRTVGETAGAWNAYRAVAFNATTTCTSCHRGPEAVALMAVADRLSTNHADHIATDRYGAQTTNYTCNTCHNNTASNNTTISLFVTHANATKDVVFNTAFWGGGTWSSSAASCSTVYCHSTGDRLGFGTPVYTTPTWTGAAITACNVCHRASGDTYATMTNAATTDRLSPAHAEHIASDKHGLNANYTCNTCHSGIADSNTVINTATGYGLHVNKAKNVLINAFGGSGTWNTPANTCTTTYCHSKGTGGTAQTGEVRPISANTSSAWTDTITACNFCHGTESGTLGAPAYANLRRAPTAAPVTTGWTNPTNVYASDDARAVFSGTGLNYLYITGFGFTTTGTITDITVIIEGNGTSTTAAERQLEVALTKSGTAVIGTTKTGTTTQLYSSTTNTDRELVLGGNNDLWGTTWTTTEINAAGFGVAIRDFNNVANVLNIDRVRVVVHTDTAPKKNSHARHMAWTGVTCGSCHNTTVATGTNTPINNFANHVNKTYNVVGTQITTAYTYTVAGGTCANSCHVGKVGTGATALSQWGVSEPDCIDCHSSAQGTRSIITGASGEFGLAWGHKKTGRGAVAAADCIVCHLEGVYATQQLSATLHGNGNIDLRDPDVQGEVAITNNSGAAFTFTKFALDLTTARGSLITNSVADVITHKFCLKCHDAGGAANTTARVGANSAFMPWGGSTGYTTANGAAAANGLINVAAQFATTNSSVHPVLGPRPADYPTAARLATPYKPAGSRGTSGIVSNGVLLNCFDCHSAPTPSTTRSVAAHGSSATNYLRGVPAVSGVPASGTNESTLCKACHLDYNTVTDETLGHRAGSAVSSDLGRAEKVLFLQYGCNKCHASNYDTAVVRPVRAMDVHGVNALPAAGLAKTGRWLAGGANGGPIAFIRNTVLFSNHNPRTVNGTTFTVGCTGMAGNICLGNRTEAYSPGGTY